MKKTKNIKQQMKKIIKKGKKIDVNKVAMELVICY